ncbi:MAG: FG-GAP repeat protein, partial [Haloechinothrix sp.]
LTPADAWFQDQFGNSVALSSDGNIALIGCHNDGQNQTLNQGAAYIFTRSTDVWTEQAKLVADDGVQGDFFGESVALSVMGDVALVGAPQHDSGGNDHQGAAYTFTGSGATWSQQAKLVASDGAAGDRFGQSVALSDEGDAALLGAPHNLGQGAAYAFIGAGAAWNQQAKLIADEGTTAAQFGRGLALEGDTALVGGRIADAGGVTYVFTRSGDTWSHQDTLAADDGVPDDGFAVSINLDGAVALSGGTALVGAPRADIAANIDQGAAYVFVLEDEAADCDGDGMSNQDELRYGLDPCNATDDDGPDGDPDGDGIPNGDEINGEVPSHPRGLYKQHFAEGAVGPFFQTDVGFFNASREEAAHVLVTVIPEAGHPAVSQWYTVDPLARVTVDLEAALAGQSTGASTRIESDQPIAGLRQMLWDTTSYGSALESGQPESSNTWYFGEGATYVFDVFHVIENENAVDANVTITYLRGQDQGPPVIQEVVVPAYTRQSIWANAVPGLESVEISAVITSDVPIVAERAMYLTGHGDRAFEAGQMGAGATALSTTWNIAEGASHYFDTFLLFGNPNDEEATVTVTFQLPEGQTVTKQYEVPAQAKRTILVDGQQDPLLEDTAFAASVSSTVPIIVERAMWWGPTSASWYEAHASLGTTATGTVFGIGEAQSGGAAAEDTYVLVSNASDTPAPVRVTLIYDDGATEEKTLDVGASSRLTALITAEFPASEGRRFSILVESVDQVPITVEVSRYQSTDGLFGNAGGTAHATKIQ